MLTPLSYINNYWARALQTLRMYQVAITEQNEKEIKGIQWKIIPEITTYLYPFPHYHVSVNTERGHSKARMCSCSYNKTKFRTNQQNPMKIYTGNCNTSLSFHPLFYLNEYRAQALQTLQTWFVATIEQIEKEIEKINWGKHTENSITTLDHKVLVTA